MTDCVIQAGDVTGAQSIARAAQLLRLVGTLGTPGLAELVAATGFSKPTVRRILLALMDAGLVAQDAATRHYHLGVETYALGQLAAQRFSVHELAIDGLVRLARASEDTAFLSVRHGFGTLCLHREEGRYPIRTHVLKPGDRHPMPRGAAGLAILSALDDTDVEIVLDASRTTGERGGPAVDARDTRARIADARRAGWALNPGLVFEGSWGIAVPVCDANGRPVAALTVAAVDTRLQADRQAVLGPLIQQEARQLEALLRRHGTLRPTPSHRPAAAGIRRVLP